MMNNNFVISFITIALIAVAASEDCDKCVHKEKCLAFGQLEQKAQDAWIAKYPCLDAGSNERSKVFGFDSVAKGDFVCCSNSLLGTTGNSVATSQKTPAVGVRYANYNNGNQNNYDDPNYNNYQNSQAPGNYGDGNGGNNGWGPNQNGNDRDYNNNGYDPNQGNYDYNTPPKNYFNTNNNPYVTQNPAFPVNTPGNVNQGGQCPVTSFPPSLQSGCCGREATDSDRIIGHQPHTPRPTPTPRTVNNNYDYNNWQPTPRATQAPPSYGQISWPSWIPRVPNLGLSLNRVARSIDDYHVANVSIGTRIAGGHETEFTQFPWTVLLKITFDYGNRRAAFNCGGSLISSRYVLTAGHCVYDKGGTVVDLDVYLAEYVKRTFPKDCKNVPGEGRKCIENIMMKAERYTLHPQYEDSQLKNDIALIRLKGNAPYTDYIRPICLPSIDIDTPQFFNLRLAVAGWGRNGRFRSDVKQSTVVNLIPQDKCRASYPGITKESLCAAGYTGEDTCKGDSGGPLMTLYGGKYEVVGVVSGKRADSPCGSSVPSLYTNVYHYRDWIRNNIKN